MKTQSPAVVVSGSNSGIGGNLLRLDGLGDYIKVMNSDKKPFKVRLPTRHFQGSLTAAQGARLQAQGVPCDRNTKTAATNSKPSDTILA